MTGRRICVFGGTFDPIHNAHLQIAEAAQKQLRLDEILFVPAGNPPHKDSVGISPYEDRFHMVEMACAPYARFRASRLEEGDARSYTVDTLERVRRKLRPEDRLFFLIGADAFDELETWHRWQRVVELAAFIVVTREGGKYHIPDKARIHRLNGIALPVSSSTIRARLAEGESTPELPHEVRAYIEKRGLYGVVRRNVSA